MPVPTRCDGRSCLGSRRVKLGIRVEDEQGVFGLHIGRALGCHPPSGFGAAAYGPQDAAGDVTKQRLSEPEDERRAPLEGA